MGGGPPGGGGRGRRVGPGVVAAGALGVLETTSPITLGGRDHRATSPSRVHVPITCAGRGSDVRGRLVPGPNGATLCPLPRFYVVLLQYAPLPMFRAVRWLLVAVRVPVFAPALRSIFRCVSAPF